MPDQLSDMRVMTVKEFAQFTSLSLGSVKRLQRLGQGPKLIQLSSKRVGVRVCDAIAWQEERVRP
jgi:predicted DNA-binding transcriptional regulator AlpA